MSDKQPLHKRINWPEWVDMQNVALIIERQSLMRADAAGLPTTILKSRQHLRKHAFGKYAMPRDEFGRFAPYVEQAAMWYAVMRTAIETYGMKQ